jgi:hypothetical protein
MIPQGGECAQNEHYILSLLAVLVNLDSVVRSTQLAQLIDSPGIIEKSLITNKVTAFFSIPPDKPMSCAMYVLPTAESRSRGRQENIKHQAG